MNESNWLISFGAVAMASFILSWLGVRAMIGVLTRRNIVDHVNNRSMHRGVVPRGGGLVIVALVLLSTLVLSLFDQRLTFFLSLTVCLGAWALLSWCDDRHDLSPNLRFGFQLLISIVTVMLFGWVDSVFGLSLGLIGPVVTVIGLLWMANLNNFMDGMDGLAASQAIIGCLTLGVWFFYLGDWQLAMVCTVVVASSYGFLMWNWQPAQVFMGDVGSVTLGALYATLIILAVNRHNIPVLSCVLVFGVFVVDASFTILNRLRKREKIWLPHRSHHYQRAGLAGVKHSKVVLFAIVLMTICSLFATFSVLYRDIITYLLGLTVLMFIAVSIRVNKLEK